MLQRACMLIVFIAVVFASTRLASAQEFCWTLTPDPDQVFLEFTQPDPDVGSFAVSVTWVRGASYTLLGGGSAEIVGEQALIDLDVHNGTAFFNANPSGHLHMSLNLASLAGPYALHFTGPNPPFLRSGIAVFAGIFTPCAALLAAATAAQ